MTKGSWEEHITPILAQLYWPPIHYRIQFNIIWKSFKAFHGMAPSWNLSQILCTKIIWKNWQMAPKCPSVKAQILRVMVLLLFKLLECGTSMELCTTFKKHTEKKILLYKLMFFKLVMSLQLRPFLCEICITPWKGRENSNRKKNMPGSLRASCYK